MKERILVFNHYYGLKHDQKRSYLYSMDGNISSIDNSVNVNKYWLTKIHPIYAMLFAFASQPISYFDYVEKVAHFMDITFGDAKKIIDPFLNRDAPFYSNFGGVVSQFPKNIIIDVDKALVDPIMYSPDEFCFESVDLQQERSFYSPRTIVFMPNNTCTTSCVYCYADRSKEHKQLDFKQVKSIVHECCNLRIRNFMLTGGDIFVYKYWKELLNSIRECNMEIGLLSTKTPLKESDIQIIKNSNVQMQFSLDSVAPYILKEMVGMDVGYLQKVNKTFEYLDKYGIEYKVATVLTQINSSVQNIIDLYEFLQKFSKIVRWEIRIARKSLYSKLGFDKLIVSKSAVVAIDEKVQELKRNAKFEIMWDKDDSKPYFKAKKGSRSFAGARCSANYSNMMILPDGKVTICEQLYWNPQYIIGDLTKQTIPEVWNSSRALALAFPRRENFRDISPCKMCKIFEECYAYPNHCIVDVLKGYGYENSDYPDPRCDKAPRFISELKPV